MISEYYAIYIVRKPDKLNLETQE